MLSQRALLVIVKLVTPRFRVRVGVRVMVSFRSIFFQASISLFGLF